MPAWLSDAGPTLMGIVNVNPDSFSDPRAEAGTGPDLDERLATSRGLVDDGATIVDLGAQSAATHLPVVDPDEEVASLVPLVTGLTDDGIAVSVDTYKPRVAAAVLAAGASVVNDYSGVEHPETVELTADHDAWYVLTHNRGRPKQRLTEATRYDDVTGDVIDFFDDQLARLEALGLAPDRVLLDPGVDLSKTPRQTLVVLREVERLLAAFDQPQLWAISRKDVLGVATGREPAGRDPATLAIVAWFAERPRTLLRVHDVAGAADFLAMRRLLRADTDLDDDALLDPALYRQVRPPAPPSRN